MENAAGKRSSLAANTYKSKSIFRNLVDLTGALIVLSNVSVAHLFDVGFESGFGDNFDLAVRGHLRRPAKALRFKPLQLSDMVLVRPQHFGRHFPAVNTEILTRRQH